MPHEPLVRAVAERQQAMLAFLADVVNMDSPTEDKALTDLIGDVFEAKARSLGAACSRDPQPDHGDNRICRFASGRSGAPKVLIVGHFDTVYAAGTVRERPFRVEGERALGPGALDMKGGLTIGLFALEALKAVRGAVPVDVTFVFNSDEETGSKRSRQVILEETVKHDLALILEPGRPGPSLTIGRKGVAIYGIDVQGVEAHAGTEPEKGINSIIEMAHKILAIQALNDPALGTTVTPGVVSGGTKPYVVPGRAALEIDCRAPSLSERDRIDAAMKEIAARSSIPGTTARLSGGFHRPPMVASDAAMDYVRRLQEIAGAVGFPLGTATTGGASDGNLTAAAGTPTIDGLGVHGGRAHSAEEFIEIESLEAKCRVLACFLADLAQRPL
jgi:glutamate carboxypeptidase